MSRCIYTINSDATWAADLQYGPNVSHSNGDGVDIKSPSIPIWLIRVRNICDSEC